MIKLSQVPPAPEADQDPEVGAEVPDTTGGPDLNIQDQDQGRDIDVIEKDQIQDAVILDQDLDLLPVRVLDTKEKGNDLVHPRDPIEKDLKPMDPKV